jgi:hypothetical protein
MTVLNTVISDAFVLYRKYFKQIISLSAIQVCGGIGLVFFFILFWTGVHMLNGRPATTYIQSIDPDLMNLQQAFYPVLVVGFIFFIILFFLLILISTACFILFMHKHETNTPIQSKEVIQKAFFKLPSLVVVSFISALCYLLMHFISIPLNLVVIFLMVLISQAYFFVLLDDYKLAAAFSKSKQVTKGQRRWLFVLWMLPLGFSPAILGYALWKWLTKVHI